MREETGSEMEPYKHAQLFPIDSAWLFSCKKFLRVLIGVRGLFLDFLSFRQIFS